MSRVRIATVGWDFPSWDESYYPEDIPADWKLAFYANDFSAVVLPEQLWRKPALNSFVEMLEDLDEAFAVYCLVQSQLPSVREVAFIKESLAGHFENFIVETQVNVEGMPGRQQSDFILPVGNAAMESCGSCFWSRLPVDTDRQLCAVILNSEPDLKTLRQQFEQVHEQLSAKANVLVLVSPGATGHGPTIEFLHQLRTLLELMAIA